VHQIDGSLFEDTRPHPFDHMRLALRFEDDVVDPMTTQQVPQHEPGGPSSNDSNPSTSLDAHTDHCIYEAYIY